MARPSSSTGVGQPLSSEALDLDAAMRRVNARRFAFGNVCLVVAAAAGAAAVALPAAGPGLLVALGAAGVASLVAFGRASSSAMLSECPELDGSAVREARRMQEARQAEKLEISG